MIDNICNSTNMKHFVKVNVLSIQSFVASQFSFSPFCIHYHYGRSKPGNAILTVWHIDNENLQSKILLCESIRSFPIYAIITLQIYVFSKAVKTDIMRTLFSACAFSWYSIQYTISNAFYVFRIWNWTLLVQPLQGL